jgi:hypothetical protein
MKHITLAVALIVAALSVSGCFVGKGKGKGKLPTPISTKG